MAWLSTRGLQGLSLPIPESCTHSVPAAAGETEGNSGGAETRTNPHPVSGFPFPRPHCPFHSKSRTLASSSTSLMPLGLHWEFHMEERLI